ncbi:TetR family transcriptional regulator [Leptospirillum ferriphilum YSK]|uniref:TetR family transcriptional regulator n=1 Tax=Leptospirillum ferriphilum YSK TaxID=1441628 RepID=A0A059Y028_9BACT|nr:TetR family transcriptional regulator [Leptospirillum ferriphilum YSK]
MRRGSRTLIEAAIQAELAEYLQKFGSRKTSGGKRSVIRNGYQPEQEVLTGRGQNDWVWVRIRLRSGGRNGWYWKFLLKLCITEDRFSTDPQGACNASMRHP